ncbi:hypothetical protein ACFXQA_06070 [Microbacterium sp. P07]|uniref:hypothetical protein n=1 Tax=Microbacterium sp. P07 TaxID=3366952 RepID=UPI0037475611
MKTSSSASTYLNLALAAFALLGLELVLVVVEPYLPVEPGTVHAALTHWLITTLVWASGAVSLVAWARRRTDFFVSPPVRLPVSPARWSAIGGLVVLTVAGQLMLRGGVLAPVAEHGALTERFGDAGTVAWIAQVVYYVAELGVMALIVAFGQRAGEIRFGRTRVPWGGMTLGVTWGLVHFLTQDAATGVYGIVLSLIMGTIYVLAGRRLRLTLPILLALFLI